MEFISISIIISLSNIKDSYCWLLFSFNFFVTFLPLLTHTEHFPWLLNEMIYVVYNFTTNNYNHPRYDYDFTTRWTGKCHWEYISRNKDIIHRHEIIQYALVTTSVSFHLLLNHTSRIIDQFGILNYLCYRYTPVCIDFVLLK